MEQLLLTVTHDDECELRALDVPASYRSNEPDNDVVLGNVARVYPENNVRLVLSGRILHLFGGSNFAKLVARHRFIAADEGCRAEAAVEFAVKVAEQSGQVGDAEIEVISLVGYDDAQIVEIIALVAANIVTNCLNEVVMTDIEFPIVRAELD
jgi:alkylhydroperoxidase family enzyme